MSEAIDIKAAAPAPAAPVVPIAGAKPSALAIQERGIVISNTEDLMRFAKIAVESGLAPYGIDTPQKAFICVQMGLELGLGPMAALQNIFVVKGRPCLWGDAVPAVCIATGQVEDYKDEIIGSEGSDEWGYRVTVKRKGRSVPIVRAFTVADAKKAGLWEKRGHDGKPTPWITNPKRMLFARARTFAFRDAFPDAQKGLYTVEEMHDSEPKNVTPQRSLDELETPKTEGRAA